VKNTERILGYQIATATVDACVEEIIAWIRDGSRGRYFVCANPHSLEVARHDRKFSQTIHHADLVVPDGIGMVLASGILGGSIRNRVTGSDIFYGVNGGLDANGGGTVFYLGSSEDILARIKLNMEQDYPNITVVGTYSPPFKDAFSEEDDIAMVTAINHVNPDVLWVGMTAPKQEKWIYRNRERLNVRFIGAVGAVFDFYTGNVKRSPLIFQKSGLEWLPRLLQQPRRLWRRNFVSNPMFMLRVIKQAISLRF
jgi:N-acetylglucosaminyldiphosphoundecaprenol N-acetyl-beta-D-mannosaminyltransferase